MEKRTKILVISGPTATGKTDLAAKIAKKYNGELISADSRQVYKGLDIGVGKDHPKNTPIHLIDLITPDQIFSVADFQRLALKKINQLHSQGKLPIIVGGTGFYINSILNPDYDTFTVKPNKTLRSILNYFPLRLLQLALRLFDFPTFSLLNNSDINNPRRLIRKIELSISRRFSPPFFKGGTKGGFCFDFLHISLTAPNQFIYSRIDARVASRLKLGHLKELKNLLKKYSWDDPGLQVSAYSVFKDCLKVGVRLARTRDKVDSPVFTSAIQKWCFAEHTDARRQKTWFKKYSSATFVDVSQITWQSTATKKVSNWFIKK